MESLIRNRRWRAAVAWSVSAALLIGYALLDEQASTEDADTSEAGAQLPEEDRGKEVLEVVEVRPEAPSPGSAIEVSFINTFKQKDRPLIAWLSITDYRTGRQFPSTEMEVLLRGEDRIVVRVPGCGAQRASRPKNEISVNLNANPKRPFYSLLWKRMSRDTIGDRLAMPD